MPKPTKGPRLGGTPTHERIILRNLASQLFEHGRVTTTETKARRVQPLAEKLITKAKRGDLHARRLVLKDITDRDTVAVLFEEIAPQLKDREGGYTRITKIGNRKGDNAPLAVIEIITESVEQSRKNKAKGKPAAAAAPAKKADKAAAPKRAKKAESAPSSPSSPSAPSAPSADDEIGEVTVGADAVAETAEGGYRGENPPKGYDIKGSEDSRKFHTPESPWYDQTIAEVWFDSAEAAEAAGFVNAVKDDNEA